MSLLTLDTLNLEILMKSEDRKIRRHAENVYPLVQRHHLLLVALLLGNSAALEALPLFLDRIVSRVRPVATENSSHYRWDRRLRLFSVSHSCCCLVKSFRKLFVLDTALPLARHCATLCGL